MMHQYKILFLLLSFAIYSPLSAQEVICHAVSTKGDTIKGYFDKITKKELQLRDLKTKNEQSIDLEMITMYTLFKKNNVNETFVKLTLPNNKIEFLERLAAGKLNLYIEKHSETFQKPMRGKVIKTVRTVTTYYLSPGTDRLTEIQETGWRAMVSAKMYDCPKLVAKLDEKGYQFKDMMNIIQEYNNCR
ncbi:MAG: hypothetical protein SFU99_18745 [Saprospiraceae bacterium]|nr:hypothetical protein [Saprospiraceae bacterium]